MQIPDLLTQEYGCPVTIIKSYYSNIFHSHHEAAPLVELGATKAFIYSSYASWVQ